MLKRVRHDPSNLESNHAEFIQCLDCLNFSMEEDELEELQRKLDQAEEEAFLAKSDLEYARTENIALKNFIQNLYESCDGLEDTELTLKEVLENLKENIRTFAKAHKFGL